MRAPTLSVDTKTLERATTGNSGPVVCSPLRAAPSGLIGTLYIPVYLLLDWISFIAPYGNFNITPWNPGTGLGFVLIILFGPRTIPFLFIARLLGELISSQTALPPAIAVVTTILSGGYVVALLVLLRPNTHFDPALHSMRDLILLGAGAASSAIFVAASSVATIVLAGLLPGEEFGAATLRYWIGEMIGITVFAPFGLVALTRTRRWPFAFELLLQFGAIVIALALVFGYAKEPQFQLFYVLFLPIIWMALRSGLEGVTLGVLLTQIGLIVGLVTLPGAGHDVTAFQTLMLALAATGLIAGQLVSENRRAGLRLQAQQKSLAHIARLGSIGELAMAIAHELNQPLMAAGTYTRLLKELVDSPNPDSGALAATLNKALAQVERATEVVKRLRALVRLDRSQRRETTVERIVGEALALCQPDLDRANASVEVDLARDLPLVMVDILQIEQVLLNLLHNAAEAISETKQLNGAIAIQASLGGSDFVDVSVTDTGPGFPPHLLDDQFHPFLSTKADGLGFGLPLSKSIIEAHGGRLWLDQVSRGASIHFTLPVVKESDHG